MSIHAVDYQNTAPHRRTGVEDEYNLQYPASEGFGGYIGDDALAAAGIAHHGYFLGKQGGRGKLYPDVGHLEFDTAECVGVASAAVADLDGIRIVSDIIDASGKPHNGLYRLAGTFIPNGLVDNSGSRSSVGRTSGYHENYMIPRSISDDPLIDMLVPSILATRIYAMNGTLHKGGFVWSQKVWGSGGNPVERSLDRRTSHGDKPMLTIPPVSVDKDTIGAEEFARGEVRVADPGMSLVARYAGLAAVSLGFRLIEHQRVLSRGKLERISLASPVDAAKEFAGDLTLKKTQTNRAGKQVTALNVAEQMLTQWHNLARRVELPPDEYFALQVVIPALISALAASRPEKAEYSVEARMRLDAAARHTFIAKGKDPSLAVPDNKAAMQRNIEWDKVLPKGPGMKYWTAVTPNDPMAQAILAFARLNGVSPRAIERAAIIDNSGRDTVQNWASYRDPAGMPHLFKDL